MTLPRHASSVLWLSGLAVAWSLPAAAQTAPGAPPADLAGAVAAPKAPADVAAPNVHASDSTNAAISAGGQFQGGNSHLYAATAQGKFDMRRGASAFAAGLIGNYAETKPPVPAGMPGTAAAAPSWTKSTENLQGKLRYEWFASADASLFLQLTGTHDAFQAIAFRMNIDPGFKLLFVRTDATKLWGEVGYDFQFDDNFTDASGFEQAGAGGQVLDANNVPYVINRTDTMHSGRAYVGFRHAFNKEVLLSAGLEYLQGFGGSGGNIPALPPGYTTMTAMPQVIPLADLQAIPLSAARVNFDTLLAAKLGAGFSLGVGFTAKYNGKPLPGKVKDDEIGTVSLIYAFSSSTAPPPAPPPCTPPPPPAPPAPPPPPGSTGGPALPVPPAPMAPAQPAAPAAPVQTTP